jgi:hypothetical protein
MSLALAGIGLGLVGLAALTRRQSNALTKTDVLVEDAEVEAVLVHNMIKGGQGVVLRRAVAESTKCIGNKDVLGLRDQVAQADRRVQAMVSLLAQMDPEDKIIHTPRLHALRSRIARVKKFTLVACNASNVKKKVPLPTDAVSAELFARVRSSSREVQSRGPVDKATSKIATQAARERAREAARRRGEDIESDDDLDYRDVTVFHPQSVRSRTKRDRKPRVAPDKAVIGPVRRTKQARTRDDFVRGKNPRGVVRTRRRKKADT